jgi:Ser/Thr protein kinase RdoA (MazF antagonist)
MQLKQPVSFHSGIVLIKMKINPHDQFVSSKERIQLILDVYGMQLQQYTPTTTGIENFTAVIKTSQGNFVLRVYRKNKKPASVIDEEIAFMDYLRSRGIFAVPEVISSTSHSKRFEVDINGGRWTGFIMEHKNGHHAENYDNVPLSEMAFMQATMHRYAEEYKPACTDINQVHVLREREFIHKIDVAAVSDDLKSFLRRAAECTIPLNANLPKGLCHLDYDAGNILVDNKSITAVLDFDDLCIAPFVVCLGYSLWHIYYVSGPTMAKSYLDSYQQTRKISKEERQLLGEIMLFRHYLLCAMFILDGQISKPELTFKTQQPKT